MTPAPARITAAVSDSGTLDMLIRNSHPPAAPPARAVAAPAVAAATPAGAAATAWPERATASAADVGVIPRLARAARGLPRAPARRPRSRRPRQPAQLQPPGRKGPRQVQRTWM